jgi:hypothetical protein
MLDTLMRFKGHFQKSQMKFRPGLMREFNHHDAGKMR